MERRDWQALEEVFELYGVEDFGDKSGLIERYVGMLKEKRAWAGLTSRALPERVAAAIAESVTVLAALERGPTRVLEIGSGGGLLGVVLSVACPEWDVTMVESSGRKAAFLAEAIGACGIENARVTRARAESLVGSEEPDACVSRAAGGLEEMAGVALGLLRPGGRYIALKQSDVLAEVEAARPTIEASGGKVAEIVRPPLPRSIAERSGLSLVVIEKL